MKFNNPTKALYIKLGRSGRWEKESLEKGVLRFGYSQTPYKEALEGNWGAVQKFWQDYRDGNLGTAKRDLKQIRYFFEEKDDVLWITFYGGTLWWCFLNPEIFEHSDGDGYRYRETVDGWHNTDVKGQELLMTKLSGNLLKTQGFRGTICGIDKKPFEYLKRKIKGELLPEVQEALTAENVIKEKIIKLMNLLTWQDFELLVDLVFASSGWRRVGELGKTQKTIDLDLVLPTTGERAFVQIKSKTTKKEFESYLKDYKNSEAYDRMFYVCHDGDIGVCDKEEIVLVGPERLAEMVFDAGLSTWLREKVS